MNECPLSRYDESVMKRIMLNVEGICRWLNGRLQKLQ
jgi:hypothetical protein